jgi:hypothetical protein
MTRTISLLLIVFTVNQVSADFIVLIGQADRKIFGRVVESDGTTIMFDERILDPTTAASVSASVPAYRRLEVDRDSVKLLVRNIDPTRLESMSPANLTAYLEYAEELVPQKVDVEARELAIRLLLICAYWAPRTNADDDVKQSALLNLQSLSRSRNEALKFQRVLDLETGLSILPPASRQPAASQMDIFNQKLLNVVQALRREDYQSAKAELNSPEMQQVLDGQSGLINRAQLLQVARSQKISDFDRRMLLKIEIALLAGKPLSAEVAMPQPDWANQSNSYAIESDYFPAIESVTEFDPRRPEFRRGQWRHAKDDFGAIR